MGEPADAPMSSGVIVYRQADAGLTGIWAHHDLHGRTACEHVSDATLAALAGTWPVAIWMPDGDDPFFVGTLSFEADGSVWNLHWVGKQGNDRKDAAYRGIGVMLDEQGILAASFEPGG